MSLISLLIYTQATAATTNTVPYLSEHELHQKLQGYIDRVNQTKAVLDDAVIEPSVKEQQQALCQRIDAYQNIVKLSNEYPEFESASVMKIAALHYLKRQKESFDGSALNQKAFCLADHQ
ncbi:hypothetical protein G9F31_15355 [Acinetobacter sp. 187]|uniref:hypothetical protein n=1 Tax=Acinetobacter lanii TaxID=2715163 RepID=UPI00140E3ED7|nr:hypothetical protein [Acinetobacter lanii]NHC05102.1 hypothetical protein [Acinetobacter lanii]